MNTISHQYAFIQIFRVCLLAFTGCNSNSDGKLVQKKPIIVSFSMKLRIYTLLTFLAVANFYHSAFSQINTGVIILDKQEQTRFKKLIAQDPFVSGIYNSIKNKADAHLKLEPSPVKMIHYEGLLETNPKRVETVKSLLDANKVLDLIYTGYGSSDAIYGEKIREIVLAWADVYEPTGNPINEHKFTSFFFGYHLNRDLFSVEEKQNVESWLSSMARKELENRSVPNNNWQAKRLKIIGTIGCIIQDEELKEYALTGLKKYISTAYFPDGTSNDLKLRDALHYHLGGIKPMLDIFINLSKFDPRFDLYEYTDSLGTSIKKAVEYTIPYISGEKIRKEWVNTKVELDKKRAAAGLAEYQPGKLFDPEDAIPMLNCAVYYNPDWFELICGCKKHFKCNFEALLNSPLLRQQNTCLP